MEALRAFSRSACLRRQASHFTLSLFAGSRAGQHRHTPAAARAASEAAEATYASPPCTARPGTYSAARTQDFRAPEVSTIT